MELRIWFPGLAVAGARFRQPMNEEYRWAAMTQVRVHAPTEQRMSHILMLNASRSGLADRL